jgi:FAD-dependent urate hydroxylase
MSDTRTALVMGGGIAGAAAALALDRVGIRPVVFEAHARSPAGAGVFLTVATNGIDALRAIDADAAVLERAFPTPAITLRSGSGKRLGEVATGVPLPDGTVSHTIRRDDLHRGLHDLIGARGIQVNYGRRLTAVADTATGVRAEFTDGTTAEADVLIGCDGVHSVARRSVDPAAPAPRFAGLLNAGGYATGVRPEGAVGTYEMIFGARAFFGYVIAPDESVWWFANVPSREEPSRDERAALAGERLRARLLERYQGDAGPARQLIGATRDLGGLQAIHTVSGLRTWHRGRMIVIGDAAHAPSPSSGQGASLAIEDAVILSQQLSQTADARTAFASFEALRRSRVERIVKWAARTNSSKAARPMGRVVRDALMPTILRLAANSRTQRHVYEHHIKWQPPASAPAEGARG